MNRRWTKDEEAFVKEFAGVLSDKEAAERLGEKVGRPVSLNSYRKKRQDLNIKKCRGRGLCKIVAPEPCEKERVGEVDS